MRKLTFPESFRWGVATSSFQIEGGADADGKGPSIWDRFCETPGNIEDGSDGKTACDHFHRWEEDVELLADLGVSTYRFSMAWPRVFPGGVGAVNQPGLSFYSRLVDALLEKSIRPLVTLYHWDLPDALQQRGGWAERSTAGAFADYAATAVRQLGDRVDHWVTHNEPWCSAILGHQHGVHAPGLKDHRMALLAAHNILLSHGLAVQAMRSERAELQVGIAHLLLPTYPASESEADRVAARRVDGEFNRWFVEPVALGRYPEDIVEHFCAQGALDDGHPVLSRPDDLATMSQPTDFFGLNYYSRGIIRAEIPESDNLPRQVPEPPQEERTTMGWEVFPRGLYDLAVRAKDEWKANKIFVTECGAAFPDRPDADGRVSDERRIVYLEGYFAEAHRAIKDAAPIEGMYVWSLLDNFEWAFGYTQRFGLTWVDYETLERRLKASGEWYRAVTRANGFAFREPAGGEEI